MSGRLWGSPLASGCGLRSTDWAWNSNPSWNHLPSKTSRFWKQPCRTGQRDFESVSTRPDPWYVASLHRKSSAHDSQARVYAAACFDKACMRTVCLTGEEAPAEAADQPGSMGPGVIAPGINKEVLEY